MVRNTHDFFLYFCVAILAASDTAVTADADDSASILQLSPVAAAPAPASKLAATRDTGFPPTWMEYYKVCGNYCGPNYCSGKMLKESECFPHGDDPEDPYKGTIAPMNCADACCQHHDHCCHHDDPWGHDCNTHLSTCLQACLDNNSVSEGGVDNSCSVCEITETATVFHKAAQGKGDTCFGGLSNLAFGALTYINHLEACKYELVPWDLQFKNGANVDIIIKSPSDQPDTTWGAHDEWSCKKMQAQFTQDHPDGLLVAQKATSAWMVNMIMPGNCNWEVYDTAKNIVGTFSARWEWYTPKPPPGSHSIPSNIITCQSEDHMRDGWTAGVGLTTGSAYGGCTAEIFSPCGDTGETCCWPHDPATESDGCYSRNDCVAGECAHCGEMNEKCCDHTGAHGVGSDGCVTGVFCKNHECVKDECGWAKESCCGSGHPATEGDGCYSRHDCVDDVCESCGDDGQKCCAHTSAHGVGSDGCIGGVYCVNSQCKKAL